MEEKLYFEGEGRVRSTTNYVVLLTLATVIATFGLIAASAATVIGAMIVAPLMTPIMASTLAIVLGNGPRLGRSVLIVVLSVAYVVGLSAALSVSIPALVVGFGSNPEILGRVSPNMLALYAAIGSGAAGAFAVSRAEIGDALPGVAIAISLVPPLCVVGLAVSHTQWLAGLGAMLLFLTNFFAIVLAGGAVFWLSGIHPRPTGAVQAHLHRRALAIAVLGTIVVAVLLGFNGYRTLEMDTDAAIAGETAAAWLRGTRYTVEGTTLTYRPGDILVRGPARVLVRIAGAGTLPGIEELATDLEAQLGYRVFVELRVAPEEIRHFPELVLVRPGASGEADAWETAPW
jgi:uncharacterized hydrophobic protein (TIGR00271 family)